MWACRPTRSTAGEAAARCTACSASAAGQPEAELGVVLTGADELVGVGLDPGGDAQEDLRHRQALGHQGLEPVQLVEGVDDDPADALGQGSTQLVGALVVAVQHQTVGGHARGAGDVVLAAGGDVEVAALVGRQSGHGRAEEGLGRVVDPGAEGGDGLPAPRPQVGLVVDEQRGAELAGQVEGVAAADDQLAPGPHRGRVGQQGERQRAHESAHICSGALTPSRSRPMARPTDAASTSSSRAWVSSGLDALTHDVAVVVEAVHRAGQLPHPRGDAVRRPVLGRHHHGVGQLGQGAQHVELALVDEQREIDLLERQPLDAPVGGHPEDRPDPGVGHLDVEDRVVVGLALHHVVVEGLRGVDRLQQVGEAGRVRTDLVEDLGQLDDVPRPSGEPHRLAARAGG